jgi:hypothetical protein
MNDDLVPKIKGSVADSVFDKEYSNWVRFIVIRAIGLLTLALLIFAYFYRGTTIFERENLLWKGEVLDYDEDRTSRKPSRKTGSNQFCTVISVKPYWRLLGDKRWELVHEEERCE